MDIYRRKRLNAVKKDCTAAQLNPYQKGSKRLAKGYRHIGGGQIKHIESGTVIQA